MGHEIVNEETFSKLFDKSIAAGPRNSDSDARAFVHHFGLSETEIPTLRHIFLRGVQAPLYEGVMEFTEKTLQDGNAITIWTEGETNGKKEWEMPGFLGQHKKVVSSGLSRMAREIIPNWAQRKEQFQIVSVEENKIDTLPAIIKWYSKIGIHHIVLADDKAKIIDKAQKKLQELREKGLLTQDVTLYWVNQGHHKDVVPKGFASKADFLEKHPEVVEVGSFDEMAKDLVSRPNDGKTGHIFDWDHTLSDTTARTEGIRQAINKQIETVYLPENQINTVHYLHPKDPAFQDIYTLLGLKDRKIPVDRVLMHSLGGGMSFVNVLRVNWDGQSYVVKFENNAERMWRMNQEKEGYDRMNQSETLLAQRLPRVLDMDHDEILGGYIVMEYFDGPNLRDAMKHGLLSDRQIIDAVHEVLNLEFDLYKDQVHEASMGHEGEWFSMAKDEWPDTDKSITTVLTNLAAELGVTPETIRTLPVVCEVNGESYEMPPLGILHNLMEETVNTTPPVVMPLLFNDLSQGNVVTIPNYDGSVTVRIVDPQWVREWSNPRADLVRPTKSNSSTTVNIEGGSVGLEDGKLIFRTAVAVPPLLLAMEEEAIARFPEFGELIGDHEFQKGVLHEMAASQWREIALIAKGRGNFGQIGFNLFNMHRFLHYDVREGVLA